VHDGAEEGCRLVVEVVAGGDDRQPHFEGGPVHQVALAEPAAGARRSPRDLLDDRDRSADLVGHASHDQRRAPPRSERLALRSRFDGVVEDAEVEVEAGGVIALVDEDVPERERVLAAGHGDQHALLAREHAVAPDRLAHLVPEELDEVVGTERGVVPAQLDGGRAAAFPALHVRPPDITGRSSMLSSSRTT
jgi:hypothetical protein